LGPRLKAELDAPLVCQFQGEDVFLDTLTQLTYALFSGRWYRTPMPKNDWKFVASDQLPFDFSYTMDTWVFHSNSLLAVITTAACCFGLFMFLRYTGMLALAWGVIAVGLFADGTAVKLEQANFVVIIPGYGMAVAQAQHKVRELYDQLKKRGITVKFAIHPVAGRMPGHMNVLLAEADIPYTDLVEMEDINRDMPQCDVALVVGANDVVNPAARTEKSSPIYGMPIIEADKARTVFAIKRSKNPGFAGIDNELYFSDRTWMLFGDAKNVVGELVKELAGSGH
jgi:hypothetical protein